MRAGVEHVLATPGEAERVHGLVLGEPQLVAASPASRASVNARIDAPALDVAGAAERTHGDGVRLRSPGKCRGRRADGRIDERGVDHSTIVTIGCATSSR